MATRAELKEASLQRVLNAAAARLRTEGLAGGAIGQVMRDAGLTHGAFYSHFENKDELTAAAFRHALTENRMRWTAGGDQSWRGRLTRLAKRYLTPAHRDNRSDGCAFAAVASEAARSSASFRQVFEEEMLKSLTAICGREPGEDGAEADAARRNDAIAFLALCVGGVTLARAVDDADFSERILAACATAAGSLADAAGDE